MVKSNKNSFGCYSALLVYIGHYTSLQQQYNFQIHINWSFTITTARAAKIRNRAYKDNTRAIRVYASSLHLKRLMKAKLLLFLTICSNGQYFGEICNSGRQSSEPTKRKESDNSAWDQCKGNSGKTDERWMEIASVLDFGRNQMANQSQTREYSLRIWWNWSI